MYSSVVATLLPDIAPPQISPALAVPAGDPPSALLAIDADPLLCHADVATNALRLPVILL